MNPKAFNNRYGPEWRLQVCMDKVHLDNIVPLYKMVIRVGEWATSMFGDPWIPPPEWDDEHHADSCQAWDEWEDLLIVPDEVIVCAGRLRMLLVFNSQTGDARYFNAGTNEQLDAAALAGLTWLWNEDRFPEPPKPEDPGFTLMDVGVLPSKMQSPLRKAIEKYVEDMQNYTRHWRVYMDANKVVEERRGGTAWCILNSMRSGVGLQ